MVMADGSVRQFLLNVEFALSRSSANNGGVLALLVQIASPRES